MTKEEAQKRLEKLRALINKYRYSRLVLNQELVEESIEDALKKELFDLEQKWPDLVTSDSPTQRVGGQPLDKFKKFPHPQKMLSFNDCFNLQDMEEWQSRLRRLDPQAVRGGFYCELKIDGLAMELIYEKGILKTGATRGDGLVGEDVTQNLKTIEAVPLSIQDTKYNIQNTSFVVRGEVFISRREFARLNREQTRAGEAVYANPRNLAAGSIRQLDPAITAQRRLDSFAYSLVTDFGQTTHEDEHRILKELGFKTNPHNRFCPDLKAVREFRDQWEKDREKLDYEIDGVVVIVNDNRMFNKLGVVGKAPRAAVAYKFSPRESITKIKNIIVSVGRTGILTPIAVLEPVHIGGTIVSRATLHNEDEIKRLDVRIGDTVVVGRAGDVIPDIKKSFPELRTGKEKIFHFPTHCPACREPVERFAGEAAYKCLNKNCPAIKREAIYHFVSKAALDIDGVGPKIIDQLMDTGLVKDAADLYNLKKVDLFSLERFATKSAENAIAAIKSLQKVALDNLIYSFGIPHVGSETAVDLARRFGSLEKIAAATAEELVTIKDIGAVVTRSIAGWFRDVRHRKLLEKFKKVGLKVLDQVSTQKSSKLQGRTLVFTGTLENLSRERGEELVREHGGDVSSSVSKETSYVVAGSETGSKLERAQKLGVKILNEEEFLKLVG